MTTFVIGFIASGMIVMLASLLLARSADGIAEATRLGRLWIGTVLLAAATSLPELTTGVASVRLGAPNIAVGELFGSSMANMLILAIVDLIARRREVLRRAARDHALAASLAIAMNAFAAVLVLARPRASFLRIDPGSVILAAAYMLGTRVVYLHGLHEPPVPPSHPDSDKPARAPWSLRRSVLVFVLGTAIVVAAAPIFAASAKGLATTTGLGETFVGTWLVGVATSLPELAACFAAIRIGALDLAVGNLFGSNAFNMAILLGLDVAQPGSLYATLDPAHALTSLLGIVLMALGIAAIVFRARRRFSLLEPNSLVMVATYGYALWLLFRQVAT